MELGTFLLFLFSFYRLTRNHVDAVTRHNEPGNFRSVCIKLIEILGFWCEGALEVFRQKSAKIYEERRTLIR